MMMLLPPFLGGIWGATEMAMAMAMVMMMAMVTMMPSFYILLLDLNRYLEKLSRNIMEYNGNT